MDCKKPSGSLSKQVRLPLPPFRKGTCMGLEPLLKPNAIGLILLSVKRVG